MKLNAVLIKCVVKCVSLEGEIVSTTMVTGEGTNPIDHNRVLLIDDKDTTGVLKTSTT